MLKSLLLRNVTVFEHAEIEFGPGLNVLVGENGSGKTHLLKLPYALMAASAEWGKLTLAFAPPQAAIEARITEKLLGVFRPESLGRLGRRKSDKSPCAVHARFDDARLDLALEFTTKSRQVTIARTPDAWVDKPPVYLPTRELLTIDPGFVSVYESHYLNFEETWRDTRVLLGYPPLKGRREARVREALAPLEQAMEGRVQLDSNGRFYLVSRQGKLEMPLVAEGWRKLAMLAQLIATGVLLDNVCLFWDEPEANLNPRLVRTLAEVVLHLVHGGLQVFLATHSLFLMREIDILLRSDSFHTVNARFIGLRREAETLQIAQGDSIDEIGPIDSLDEELRQSDRFLEVAAGSLRQLVEGRVPGEELVLTVEGDPKAVVTKPARTTWPCQPGTANNTTHWMAPDFDAPLENFAEYME